MTSRELEKVTLPIRALELKALLRAYNADFISRKVIAERIRSMEREIRGEDENAVV